MSVKTCQARVNIKPSAAQGRESCEGDQTHPKGNLVQAVPPSPTDKKNEILQSQGGASLVVAWRLKDQRVLVVGGSSIAERRAWLALEADAKVTVVAPREEIAPELMSRILRGEVEWIDRKFAPQDLEGKAMVLAAIDDRGASLEIAALCRQKRIAVNCADIPDCCDFWFMSTHRDGPLQIAVSTNGHGPKLAALIRREICKNLSPSTPTAIERISTLRNCIREIDPEPHSSLRRMTWISSVCEKYSIAKLGELTDEQIATLLQQYKNGEEANLETKRSNKGRIELVGAGPGDPDLLTRAAYRAITAADVVIADYLVPQPILDEIPKKVQLIVKPKAPSDATQPKIDDLALEALNQGKYVVRLKGGDPFVFGRGGEEVLFYRRHGYEPKVIPGVSSSIVAPLSVGIPVTHRGLADQFLVTTGTGKGSSFPDIPPFSPKRTTIYLMGMSRLKLIVEKMIENGYPSNWPVAVIEKATHPDQRVVYGKLSSISDIVIKAKICAPATVVVGQVATLGEASSATLKTNE